MLLILFGATAARAATRVEAESYSSMYGVVPTTCSEGGHCLGYIHNGDYAAYANVDLTNVKGFNARISCATANGGNIQIRLDSATGPLLGTCPVANTGGWNNWATVSCLLTGTYTGTHTLYLVFTGASGYLLNINWFELASASEVYLSDSTLQPVVTDNLPVFTSVSGYDLKGAGSLQVPLFTPYDSAETVWWDNLIQEQLQARIPVITFATRGWATLSGTPVPTTGGNMDPRRLFNAIDAINRAGASSHFKLLCGVDTPSAANLSRQLHGTSGPMDLSVESDWTDVWWTRMIKPWFDTVPPQYWYRINGRPVIQLWSIRDTWFSNQYGNASRMLEYLENEFIATYGEDPVFITLSSWLGNDPTCYSVPAMVGAFSWFGGSTGAQFTDLDGFVAGTAIAAYGTSIPRNGMTGTGTNGDTFIGGLQDALNNHSNLTFLEGWTNQIEQMGFYRSRDSAWDYPNQYINILRSFNDLRSVTLKLEAEGADNFSPMGSGTVFRTDGLNVRNLTGSGWAVTGMPAGGYIEFSNVPFSAGNYVFPVRYASTAARTLQLSIDGIALESVSVPSTGDLNTFSNIYLGTTALSHGNHTIRLTFVDGGVDVDWVFAKKSDWLMSFKSALNSKYLTAELGGNSTITAKRSVPTAWEYFTADDLTGAGVVYSNDLVNLQVHNGRYLCAEGGGGGALSPNRVSPGLWEGMSIVKVTGSGALSNGDQVALRTSAGNFITVQSNGSVDAAGSSIGTAQTFTIQMAPITAIPAPVSNFTATAISGSQINLAWTDSSTNETGFLLERSADGTNYSCIATLASGTTSYSDTGLPGEVTFTYRIRSSNATGNSELAYVSATTPAGTPAIPSNFTATVAPTFTAATVTLAWDAVPGATSYNVKRSTTSGTGYIALGSTSSPSFSDSTATIGTTYYYVVSAVNAFGQSGNSAQSAALPTVFSHQDIGTGSVSGTASCSGTTFTVAGTGGDIWGTADAFHFVYRPMTGNGTIVARVASLTASYGYARSGVMMRETLSADAANVLMSLLQNERTNFQYRAASGAVSNYSQRTLGITPPQWVALQRSGDTFTGYYSDDGVNWCWGGQTKVTMADTIFVGLAESHISTATIDNVTVPGM